MKAELLKVAATLRSLAHDTYQTAIGSSRIDMYRAIADQLTAQAEKLEALAKEIK